MDEECQEQHYCHVLGRLMAIHAVCGLTSERPFSIHHDPVGDWTVTAEYRNTGSEQHSSVQASYRVYAVKRESVIEFHVDLMNLRGEWVEVFHAIDPAEVKRYLRTRTDPGADIKWEMS
jgi:hypothetical protein